MKKYLSVGISSIMACSLLFAATACNEEKDGVVVKGNYTTVTTANAEQFSEAISKIDSNLFLGNMEQVNWKMGLSLDANLAFDFHLKEGEGNETKLKLALDAKAKASGKTAKPDAEDALGNVNMLAGAFAHIDISTYQKDVREDNGAVEEETMEQTIDFAAYVDSLTTYAAYEVLVKENGIVDEDSSYTESSKLETVSWLEDILETFDSISIDTDFSSMEETLAEFAEYGVTLAYDDSGDDLKIKVSLSSDTFTTLFRSLISDDENPVITVNNSKFDIYFLVKANGELGQFSVDANIDVNVQADGDFLALKF